jgi:hypothetical protein
MSIKRTIRSSRQRTLKLIRKLSASARRKVR